MTRQREIQPQRARRKRPWGIIVVVLLVVLGLIIYGVLAGSNAFRWRNLTSVDGRFTYTANGQPASLTGVDVSDHNDYVNWRAVANDGIDFAFIRVGNRGYTEGLLYADSRFEENFTGARANGLAVGVYFFSQAKNEQEAIEEADFVINALRGRSLDLPVVFDWETISYADARTDGMTSQTLTPCALAFCKRIEEAGYKPMVYMNLKDSLRYEMHQLKDYPIWYAQYDVARPSANFDISMWQYSSSGDVAGIDGSTDLNILFLDASRPVYERF